LGGLLVEPLEVELVEELEEPAGDGLVGDHPDHLLHALGHAEVRRGPGPESGRVVRALDAWHDGVAQRAQHGSLAVGELGASCASLSSLSSPRGILPTLTLSLHPTYAQLEPDCVRFRAMIRRRLVIGAAGLAALGGGGVAYAVSQDRHLRAPGFLNDVRGRLHVSPSTLKSAIAGALSEPPRRGRWKAAA